MECCLTHLLFNPLASILYTDCFQVVTLLRICCFQSVHNEKFPDWEMFSQLCALEKCQPCSQRTLGTKMRKCMTFIYLEALVTWKKFRTRFFKKYFTRSGRNNLKNNPKISPRCAFSKWNQRKPEVWAFCMVQFLLFSFKILGYY